MTKGILMAGAALALLLAPAHRAAADDATAVLLMMRGEAPVWPGPVVPEFLSRGQCFQHMHYESFPIGGYRCVRDHDWRG